MMIRFTENESKLYDKLEVTKDPDEIAEIRRKLKEISEKRKKELTNCPFEH